MSNTFENITLGEVAKIENGTVESILSYLAGKGVTIPADPDYALSATELKAIDPILAFNLKYRTPKPKSTSNLSDNASEEQSNASLEQSETLTDLVNLSKLRKENATDEEAVEKKPEQKQKQEQRLIGIIKFYDYDKGFGYLVTNNKGINNARGIESQIKEVFVHRSGVVRGYTPCNGHWVVFTKGKDRRGGLVAKNLSKLKYDKESILQALKYRGSYAKILGWDSKREHNYQVNIILHVFNAVKRATCRSETFKDALFEYIEKAKDEIRESIIEQLYIDETSGKIIDSILQEYNGDSSTAYTCLKAYSTKKLFTQDNTDWDKIAKLFNDGTDISAYYSRIKENITKNANNRSSDIQQFFEIIGVDGIKLLYSEEELLSLNDYVAILMYNALGESFYDVYDDTENVSCNIKTLLYLCSEKDEYIEEI